MENKQQVREFVKQLERRALEFGMRIIRLSSILPTTAEGKVVKTQLTKCGTSIGANYREANRSRSKSDFQNKISICETEASETQYWIEMIRELEWVPWERLEPEYKECSELLAIFTSIGRKK